jgi:hypothetical protein
MTTTADKLLTALLADMATNRADAIAKMIDASRNASSLEGLRAALEHIARHMERIDCMREENYRKAVTHSMKD